MAIRQDTLWEKFLSPLIQGLLDKEQMMAVRDRINWHETIDRYQAAEFIYPKYYQSLINEIDTYPRQVLDLGCGTGSTTLLLKQTFPNAVVTGLDLSPYMLAIAEDRASRAGVEMQWQHGMAESTQLESGSFDLITASLLFHETPPAITQAILTESYRLLSPGGAILILDGNQRTLRSLDWLNNIFEEPYIQTYAAGNLDAWLGKAGFDAVETKDVFWINQVTRGIRL
jgi:ubiquinone/menaquinone biosynthesis C-methylase UbiE